MLFSILFDCYFLFYSNCLGLVCFLIHQGEPGHPGEPGFRGETGLPGQRVSVILRGHRSCLADHGNNNTVFFSL